MRLPFRVTICGIDELAGHCEARATHVLSILDPEWPVPDAFAGFGAHEKLELRFHDIIEERTGEIAPQRADVERLLMFGRSLDHHPQPAHLLVHCHAGVSRSSAATALLIAQALPAESAEAVFGEVLRLRPQIWPNLRIVEMGDVVLGRGGTLMKAARDIYRLQLAKEPELEAEFRAYGRGREIEAALAEGG